MKLYEDLLLIKGSGTCFDGLEPIAVQKASDLQKNFPNIPIDYIAFLLEVGYGNLSDNSFMFYDGLVEAEEIYDEQISLDEIILFGDDLQGFNTGFNTKNWTIVEIDPTNMQINFIANSFSSYIREKLV